MNQETLEAFYKDIKKYLNKQDGYTKWYLEKHPIDEVTGVREVIWVTEGCANGTCGGAEVEIIVYYLDNELEDREVTVDLEMADFIRSVSG